MRKFIFAGFIVVAVAALTGCAKPATVDSGDTDTATSVDEVPPPDVKTSVSSGDGEIKIPVVYFDFDSYTIRADQQNVISVIAAAVANSSGRSFRIEGNCDEWGTDEYNYALGLRRAKAVQDALVSAGASLDQLQLISYGESNPVCVQSASDCWRQNRRAEITVLQ